MIQLGRQWDVWCLSAVVTIIPDVIAKPFSVWNVFVLEEHSGTSPDQVHLSITQLHWLDWQPPWTVMYFCAFLQVRGYGMENNLFYCRCLMATSVSATSLKSFFVNVFVFLGTGTITWRTVGLLPVWERSSNVCVHTCQLFRTGLWDCLWHSIRSCCFRASRTCVYVSPTVPLGYREILKGYLCSVCQIWHRKCWGSRVGWCPN